MLLPQIDFSTYSSQIFWSIVSFGILYFMVSKLIVPKFEKVLVNREKNIADNIKGADALSKEISSLKKDYETNINNTKNEANTIREEQSAKFNSLYQSAKYKLGSELEALRISTLADIDKNISEFKSQQKEYAIDLADFMIEKILQKKANNELLVKCYKKLI